MSQTWTDDIYDPDHEADDDLQNIENNFAALKSTFSGTSAPANTVAGMQWFDTDSKVLKARDAANSTWYGLMHGDADQKIWIYRNDAMDGWVIDSSVSDKVLALKGGSTYTDGGAVAGDWTISGLSGGSHSHTVSVPDHKHTLTYGSEGQYGTDNAYLLTSETTSNPVGSSTNSTSSDGVSISHDGSWRPAATVGTLQYLNV